MLFCRGLGPRELRGGLGAPLADGQGLFEVEDEVVEDCEDEPEDSDAALALALARPAAPDGRAALVCVTHTLVSGFHLQRA